MDNIDKKIQEIVTKEIHPSENYKNTINSTLQSLENKKYSNNRLRMAIASVCVSAFLISGVVFAKDIERYVKKIFNNSTEAIDSAVEEGYVQEIKDDFTYDNGFGIKIDNILLDNVNLIFSLLYKVEESNIESISINHFSIYTENGERIYQCDGTNQAYVGIARGMQQANLEKISEKNFKNTMILNLWENRNEFSELNIKITNLNIMYSDGNLKSLDGNWEFNIKISATFKQNNEMNYVFDGENEYIKSGYATIYPTKMIVKLELFEDYDINQIVDIALEDLSQYGMLFSLKNNERTFKHTNFDYIADNKELIIIFENIGSYMELEDELELSLKTYNTKILLKKQNNK